MTNEEMLQKMEENMKLGNFGIILQNSLAISLKIWLNNVVAV